MKENCRLKKAYVKYLKRKEDKEEVFEVLENSKACSICFNRKECAEKIIKVLGLEEDDIDNEKNN